MNVPQYSFKDQESDINQLPVSITIQDDDDEGAATFSLSNHSDDFYRATYQTDEYTREITFTNFRQVISEYMTENNYDFVEISLHIACGGDSTLICFDVSKSDLQFFTLLSPVMFTTDMPTVVIGTAKDSVEVQLLVNTKVIFSSTYYSYGKRVNIFDLRSVIENYCRTKNLSMVVAVLKVIENKHTDEQQITFLMADRYIHGIGADEFLSKHFFTTNTSQLIAKEQPVDLTFYVSSSVRMEITAIVRLAGGSINQSSYSRLFDKSGVLVADVSYKQIYNIFSQVFGSEYELLSYTVTAGDRLCRFYVSPVPCSRAFKFRNCFNVFEYIAVPTGTVAKTETSFSEALLAGSIAHYDIQTARTFEAETPVLLRQHAEWMNQLLQSREIYLADNGSATGPMVLIKEYTSELSDEPGAENAIKFTWQFADLAETAETLLRPSRIFSPEYNEKFC